MPDSLRSSSAAVMRQSYGPMMLACVHHPELGSFAYLRRSAVHVIDLASCRDRVVRTGVNGTFELARGGRIRVQRFSATVDTADGRFAASVRATGRARRRSRRSGSRTDKT